MTSIIGRVYEYFLQHPHVRTGRDAFLKKDRRSESHTSPLRFCDSVENGMALGIKVFRQSLKGWKSAGRRIFPAGVLEAPFVQLEQ